MNKKTKPIDMAAVIRVKRRIDEEPLNAFVLNCKKRKTVHDANNEKEVNEVTDEEVSTILRFAGTVKDGVRKINKYFTMYYLFLTIILMPTE